MGFRLPDHPHLRDAQQRGCGDGSQARAADLVHKPVSIAELSAALRRAAVRVREQRVRVRALQARAALDTLSAREREVVDGLVRGFSSKEIARALGLSPRTIEMYRSRLHRKLDVLSVAELVAIGCRAAAVHIDDSD